MNIFIKNTGQLLGRLKLSLPTGPYHIFEVENFRGFCGSENSHENFLLQNKAWLEARPRKFYLRNLFLSTRNLIGKTTRTLENLGYTVL